MKLAYQQPPAFHKATRELLSKTQSVLDDYLNQGMRVTLRQLYYQLVSSNTIPNTKGSYQKLSILLSSARKSGLVDWDAIEDRTRPFRKPPSWESPEELMETVLDSFRLDRQLNQPNYIEIWTEKDALAEILRDIAEPLGIPVVVCKGYNSTSAMEATARRIQKEERDERMIVILYIGDHDPSGLDMSKGIPERLSEYLGKNQIESSLIFQRLAITQEQIRKFNCPPSLAKLTDRRAKAYISQYGNHVWEVDAIPAKELQKIILDSIKQYQDAEVYEATLEQESQEKERLKEMINK